MKCSRLFFVGRMHQCQQVLRQIGRNAGVDVINLARLALKGRIQASTEHIQVALAGQPQCLLIAGKLAQKPVAVIELMNQRPALMNRLLGLPLRAAVEPRQLAQCSDYRQAEFRVFSQWGEDGIIQHLLKQALCLIKSKTCLSTKM